MRVLFEGRVPIDYGQVYVISRELPDMHRAFAGQVNGLCGAAVPGNLFLMTGTHYGRVNFRIELYDREPPPAGPGWEEVVEVPFALRADTVDLVPWGDASLAELPLTPDVSRVRYCAAGMDQGSDPYGGFDPDELEDGDYTYMEQRPDRYLLAFWPAGTEAGEVIVRRTSRSAEYWHGWAAGLPAPPTLWEQVEAELAERAERERRAEEHRRREEERLWGGRAPGDRLRRVRGNVFGLARVDRDLMDGVAGADEATQRRIAVWAARQAFAYAGIADLDWMAPAWAALERGEPLPPEFADPMALWMRLGSPPIRYSAISVRPSGFQPPDPIPEVLDGAVNRVSMALPALAAAAGPDPLQAALEALWAGVTAYGQGRGVFLTAVRRAFPIVDREGPVT
ncbi:hypothetical protein AB0J83_00665 [Actinoplanes sp. NPDC049596]|uniref:hypothetical protein n=1 Tax=unclassified Actinoplanes TaxID=2626549 RepID=UPI00343A8472